MSTEIFNIANNNLDKFEAYKYLIEHNYDIELIKLVYDIEFNIDTSQYENDRDSIEYVIEDEEKEEPSESLKTLNNYIQMLYNDHRLEKSKRMYYVAYYTECGDYVKGYNSSKSLYRDLKNTNYELWNDLNQNYTIEDIHLIIRAMMLKHFS
jgi:hypothetical protein